MTKGHYETHRHPHVDISIGGYSDTTSVAPTRTFDGDGIHISIMPGVPYDVEFESADDVLTFPLGTFSLKFCRDEFQYADLKLKRGTCNFHPTGHKTRLITDETAKPVLIIALDRKYRVEIAEDFGLKQFESSVNIEGPSFEYVATAGSQFLSRHSNGGRLVAQSIAVIAMSEAFRALASRSLDTDKFRHRLAEADMSRVKDYIAEHLADDLSLQQLADLVGLSMPRFSRVFNRQTGSTPHAYVLAQRVERALVLLENSNLPIVEIAYEVGFSSQAHMTDTIRRQIGITPAKYRREKKS